MPFPSERPRRKDSENSPSLFSGTLDNVDKQDGEMAEWLKAHAWKACLPQGNQGSNPCLSAKHLPKVLKTKVKHIESWSCRREQSARIVRIYMRIGLGRAVLHDHGWGARPRVYGLSQTQEWPPMGCPRGPSLRCRLSGTSQARHRWRERKPAPRGR